MSSESEPTELPAHGSSFLSVTSTDAPTINIKLSNNLAPAPKPGSEEYETSGNTDHMITVTWSAGTWQTPELRPVGDLAIPPTASVLHYATECFEGMKAYRGYDGKLRLFRPDCNGERLSMSSTRTALPAFPPKDLKHLIARLLSIDGPRWLPKEHPGRFLYVRPAMVGMGKKLGLKVPDEALLFILSLAGGGGFGYAKLGANYGPSLESHGLAAASGYSQVLWLFGENRLITEAGSSNFFAVIRDEESGQNTLVTPSLNDNLILPGITRRSVLELARSRLAQGSGTLAPLQVAERQLRLSELEHAWKNGRLLEAFVVGTAYSVTSVSSIGSQEQDMKLGIEGYGPQISSWLDKIRFGEEDHKWAVVVEEHDS